MRSMRAFRTTTVACLLFGLAPATAADVDVTRLPAAAEKLVEFTRDVEPLLRARCLTCHGVDEQQGGLRLDSKERALEGGDSGEVIASGKSEASVLIHLVAGILPNGARMPPEGKGKPLTPDEVATLRAWIDQGLSWPEGDDAVRRRAPNHWAFQPIADPEPPLTQSVDAVRNPIDAFIIRRLEKEGIQPAPAADPLTLLRRLHLDMTGLPPRLEDIDSFLKSRQDNPNAYEAVVDRLLASPHYGERWGRLWLDMARYADSDGYEKDRPRPHAWRWRDWVIQALNRDLPFDTFTIEQLAGDMLPEARTEQKVATGFHRNTLRNTEGGVDQEEDRAKRTVDRTNTLGEVWLGLTVECAQCHSHKYDPLTQREYYSLYAFFNNITPRDISAPYKKQSAAHQRAKATFDQAHAKFLAPITAYERDRLPGKLAKWKAALGAPPPKWKILTSTRFSSKRGAQFEKIEDGSLVVFGKNDASDVYTVTADTELTGLTAIRLEVLPDKRFPDNGSGRAFNGNFMLARFVVTAAPLSGGDEVVLALQRPQADYEQYARGVSGANDDKPETGWSIYPHVGKAHAAVFELQDDLRFEGGARLRFELHHGFEPDHNIGRFRLSVISFPRPVDREIVDLFAQLKNEWTDEAQAKLVAFYRSIDPELVKLKAAADEHAKQRPVDPEESVRAQTVLERSEPRVTNVHMRGDFLSKGPEVQARVPEALPPIQPRGERPDRLDLARWLVTPEHPLTPRVTVNRVWQQYFGRGLVATDNDFGTQGEKPSHPELLDWLARQFVNQGWSLKALHRLIVTSATYRQSSVVRKELLARDPLNVWVARQQRLRVEAEVIRDLALAVSGRLHPRIGGPSVYPPQPEGLNELGFRRGNPWRTSIGVDRYRRGLYTFFQRMVPYPMLITFDAADSNTSCTRRERSNTPLQALTLWNDPVFFDFARAFGRRIVREAPAGADAEEQVAKRVEHAARLALGRSPRPGEVLVLRELYAQQLASIMNDPKTASEITGPRPIPENGSPPEVAAWILVGRALMNMDEFITRE